METYTEERPWGKFKQLCQNQEVTVKIIEINPHSELSLQYHNFRDEFWKIIEGSGQIVLGDKTIDTKTNDEFFIPKKTNHRMLTLKDSMKVLEISFGRFDEQDIVRLEDKYNRK